MKELMKFKESGKLGIITCASLIAYLLLGADITSAFIITVCGFATTVLYMFADVKNKKYLKYWVLVPFGIGVYGAAQGGVLAVAVFLMTIFVALISVNAEKLEAECSEEE
ncbi:MAG: hypothetical protein J6N49_06500 [Alphaproteobacteria bacterium]|nr:hypothetical protein [Alphaproteobacteria bacterium]